MALLLLIVACASSQQDRAAPDARSDTGVDSGDSGGVTADSSFDLDPAECPQPSGYIGQPAHAAGVLFGEGVWTLDFDAEAEAAGYVDCSYHRRYPALVEMAGHAWQCPDCSLLTAGETIVDEGYEDCLSLISSADATRVEHLGIGEINGVTHVFRTGGENLVLADMGEAPGAGTPSDPLLASWEDDGTFTDGGGFFLTATLELVRDVDESLPIEDPNVALPAVSACGWPHCNPGGPSSTQSVATGSVLPNERFADVCGGEYDLWDGWGRYLVIDASSPDCGPCRTLAENEEAWVEAMARRGITVEWITLLNASLSMVNQPADADVLASWVDSFGSTGPVVADEGYAYGLFPAYLGDTDGGMGFPTMIVVNPDMEVLGSDGGFATEDAGGTGFSVMEALIVADAATR